MAGPVLTSQSEDFPQWYQEILAKAELADNGPVRGTMVIRPYGYAIWERIQGEVDHRIKQAGAQNVYLPLFIPESYLHKEAEHVEGFSPELAVVTHAGGKELEEPVVVRPTSETLFGEVMSKWIQSYRDLPLLLNQWANVVRWELRPRVFLRTTEFLWQEGHTAHASREEAAEYALGILHNVYRDFFVNVLAIPVFVGRKTKRERFAGAVNTLACEAMMRDGKALQMATSHELGQTFAKAFDIDYTSEAGNVEHAWTTSWGSSTRMVGGLIMAQGDDNGLRLPPVIAPIQAVVIAIRADEEVIAVSQRLNDELAAADVRVKLDADVSSSYGRRVTDWELKGVPLRIEIGPRDLAQGKVTLVRRDNGEKTPVDVAGVSAAVSKALADMQGDMLAASIAAQESLTADVSSVADAAEAAQTGFARLPFSALGETGEDELAHSGVTVRCIQRADGSVPLSEDEPDLIAIVAKAY